MPLLKGKSEIGHNVTEMEEAGHSKAQSVAAALKSAGVAKAKDKAKDMQPGTVTAPSAGIPAAAAEDGSFSFGDMWPGR